MLITRQSVFCGIAVHRTQIRTFDNQIRNRNADRYLLTDFGPSGPEVCRSYELRVLHVVIICLFQSVVPVAPLTDNRYHANVCASVRFQFLISHMVQNRLYCICLKWNSFLRSFHISATLRNLQFHICWHIKKIQTHPFALSCAKYDLGAARDDRKVPEHACSGIELL